MEAHRIRLADVHLGAGLLQAGHPQDVVIMAMGQQHRLTGKAPLLQKGQHPGPDIRRIHHKAFAFVAPGYHIGVDPHGACMEAFNMYGHGSFPFYGESSYPFAPRHKARSKQPFAFQ